MHGPVRTFVKRKLSPCLVAYAVLALSVNVHAVRTVSLMLSVHRHVG